MLRAIALGAGVGALASVLLYDRGYRVRLKDSGVLAAFSPNFARYLWLIDDIHKRTVGREGILTSGRDGTHSRNSKHYTGDAGDYRIHDLTATQQRALAVALDDGLNASGHVVDVIVEATHFHLEYDPATYRKGVMKPSGQPAYT